MAKRCFLLAAAGVLLFLSCAPKETQVLLGPSAALGTVLADEAARVAGAKKQVAIISPDASWGAVSATEEAFRNAMKKLGFTTVTAKAANLASGEMMATCFLARATRVGFVRQRPPAPAPRSLPAGPAFSM